MRRLEPFWASYWRGTRYKVIPTSCTVIFSVWSGSGSSCQDIDNAHRCWGIGKCAARSGHLKSTGWAFLWRWKRSYCSCPCPCVSIGCAGELEASKRVRDVAYKNDGLQIRLQQFQRGQQKNNGFITQVQGKLGGLSSGLSKIARRWSVVRIKRAENFWIS